MEQINKTIFATRNVRPKSDIMKDESYYTEYSRRKKEELDAMNPEDRMLAMIRLNRTPAMIKHEPIVPSNKSGFWSKIFSFFNKLKFK